MTPNRQKVLVLDGNQRSALAAVRSLGRAGLEIHVGADVEDGIACHSSLTAETFCYPSPEKDADGARREIIDYVASVGAGIVFPMSDITTHLMLDYGTASDNITVPCPDFETYEHASDKGRLTETANGCGVAVPNSRLIDQSEPLKDLPADFDFPVVLKPTRSRIATDAGYISTAVTVAQDLNEFRRIQETLPWLTTSPWLLQSFICGRGQGVFAIYDHGRPVAWFAHERIREKPPSGGVSVVSKSAPLSTPLKTAAKTLLDELQWHGPAMVEFRVTDDGTPYLMEINARFWGSLQLAVSAGVNFPLLAAQIAMGEHPEPVEKYKLGVYNRWLLGDLDNLYLTLKAPRRDFTLGQKLAAIGKFVIPWWPGLHYEVNQWGDLGPFWHELKQYLR